MEKKPYCSCECMEPWLYGPHKCMHESIKYQCVCACNTYDGCASLLSSLRWTTQHKKTHQFLDHTNTHRRRCRHNGDSGDGASSNQTLCGTADNVKPPIGEIMLSVYHLQAIWRYFRWKCLCIPQEQPTLSFFHPCFSCGCPVARRDSVTSPPSE